MVREGKETNDSRSQTHITTSLSVSESKLSLWKQADKRMDNTGRIGNTVDRATNVAGRRSRTNTHTRTAHSNASACVSTTNAATHIEESWNRCESGNEHKSSEKIIANPRGKAANPGPGRDGKCGEIIVRPGRVKLVFREGRRIVIVR